MVDFFDRYPRALFLCLAGFAALVLGASLGYSWIGFDRAAASALARGHAGRWAAEHGYEGPIDCEDVTTRDSAAWCLVRAKPGDTRPTGLWCSVERCREVRP